MNIVENYNQIRKNFLKFCESKTCEKKYCPFFIDNHNCEGVKTLNNYVKTMIKSGDYVKSQPAITMGLAESNKNKNLKSSDYYLSENGEDHFHENASEYLGTN